MRKLVWVALVIAAACVGRITQVPGSETEASSSTGGSGGGSGTGLVAEKCVVPQSGYCLTEADCACSVCEPLAMCQSDSGGCLVDGVCQLGTEDSCICDDCEYSSECVKPYGYQCDDDGECNAALENCGCADCWSRPECTETASLCAGGAPDGVCNPYMFLGFGGGLPDPGVGGGVPAELEACDCNDCLNDPECFDYDYKCSSFWCELDTPCVCEGCHPCHECFEGEGGSPGEYCFQCEKECAYRNDCAPDAEGVGSCCKNDGNCDWHSESCLCDDCALLPQCDTFGTVPF